MGSRYWHCFGRISWTLRIILWTITGSWLVTVFRWQAFYEKKTMVFRNCRHSGQFVFASWVTYGGSRVPVVGRFTGRWKFAYYSGKCRLAHRVDRRRNVLYIICNLPVYGIVAKSDFSRYTINCILVHISTATWIVLLLSRVTSSCSVACYAWNIMRSLSNMGSNEKHYLENTVITPRCKTNLSFSVSARVALIYAILGDV